MTYGFDEQGVRRIRAAVRQVLGGPRTGSQRRRQPPVLGGGGGGGGGGGTTCGACNDPAGTQDIDLGSIATDLIASEFYGFDPFCNGLLDLIFTFDSIAGGIATYTGDAESMEIVCTGDTPTTFTAEMEVTGYLPGQVNAYVSDGTSTWGFTNEAAWQPDQNTPLLLASGPQSCPCSPFRQFPCLRPRLGP